MVDRTNRLLLAFAIAIAISTGGGCGKSGNPDQPTTTPPAPGGGTFDGAWSGTLGAFGRISFTVSGSAITTLTFSGLAVARSPTP